MFKTSHISLTNHPHYKILVTADYLHYTTRVNKLSQLCNLTQTNPGWSRLHPPSPLDITITNPRVKYGEKIVLIT